MVDIDFINLYDNIYVLGNNYDGILLTGDTIDVTTFSQCKLLGNVDFKNKLLNHKYINFGLKNAALIDGIYKIKFIKQ